MLTRQKTTYVAFLFAFGCGESRDAIGTFDSLSDSAGETGGGSGPSSSVSASGGADDDTGSAGSADGPGDDGPGDDDDIRFDVGKGSGGPGDEGGGPIGPCGCGEDEWSYIWVSNSSQSTVSKINTRTLQEEGRYRTRADSSGNPSRTSVSLGGRAVAVANRNGGVVKIWAREQFCDPMRNGQPGLQTSTNNTPLAFDQDDCIAWFTDFPSYSTQRPIAWAGKINEDTCDDEAVWTSGCGGGFSRVNVHLLDGATGAIRASIEIPGMTCGGFGGYGGAVDPDGNFWVAVNGTTSGAAIAFVDYDTHEVQTFGYPSGFSGYGMTVDNKGRPWVSSYGSGAGIGRLDPDTGQWTTAGGFTSQGGVQQGIDFRIWVATQNGAGLGNSSGVAVYDPETLQMLHAFTVPGGLVKGISLDVDGFLWAVTGSANKFDPNSYAPVGSYNGLSGPYTYSDMTGWGLQNANCNPPPAG